MFWNVTVVEHAVFSVFVVNVVRPTEMFVLPETKLFYSLLILQIIKKEIEHCFKDG